MGQTQQCHVCERSGVIVTGHLYCDPGDAAILLVGQCPRCRRFICADHAEKLSVTRGRFARTGLSLAQCPFDPDVPLGNAEPAGP
jgi:hypothetical protein